MHQLPRMANVDRRMAAQSAEPGKMVAYGLRYHFSLRLEDANVVALGLRLSAGYRALMNTLADDWIILVLLGIRILRQHT